MTRYELLYRRAIAAEAHSQSPRIRAMHAKGLHCRVSLGVTDENQTIHLFLSRNPGGELTQPNEQTVAESIEEGCDMAKYVATSFPHARNLGKRMSRGTMALKSTFLLKALSNAGAP